MWTKNTSGYCGKSKIATAQTTSTSLPFHLSPSPPLRFFGKRTENKTGEKMLKYVNKKIL